VDLKTVSSADGNRVVLVGCFDDVRHTQEVQEYIEMAQLNSLEFTYVTQMDFGKAVNTNTDNSKSEQKSNWYDGQVSFVAIFDGPTSAFKTDGAKETVRDFAEKFGEVRAFAQNEMADMPNLEYRAEYFRISAAKKALANAGKANMHSEKVCRQPCPE
jgi:hypothetical protein